MEASLYQLFIVLGHSLVLHVCLSVLGPGHGSLPCCSGFLSRNRSCQPPPHVVLQVDQSDHSLGVQLTLSRERKFDSNRTLNATQVRSGIYTGLKQT